jgi:hypothetical protein
MKKPDAFVGMENGLTPTSSEAWVFLTLPDGTKDKVEVKYPFLAERIVGSAKRGDLKLFRAVKKMNESGLVNGEVDVLVPFLAEEWSRAPCMYMGVPNKSAMFLLTGLRRPISAGWRSTKNGGAIRDFSICELHGAGLMREIKTDKRVLFKTTINGHALLDLWANKNKAFAGFLKAYSPRGWKEKECERIAFALMEGKDAGLCPTKYNAFL